MFNYPCRDCQDRAVGCHSTCPKYTAAKSEHTRNRIKVQKLKVAEDSADDYECERKIRLNKRYDKRR